MLTPNYAMISALSPQTLMCPISSVHPHRLFQNAPFSFTLLFSFGTLGEKMKSSAAFDQASVISAETLDALVACLGTADAELLTSQLQGLVQQYRAKLVRVRPEHWKLITTAVVNALEETTSSDWNAESRQSWETAIASLVEQVVQLAKGTQ